MADKGIVPDRRVYDIPDLGSREMRGPYDITFEIQAKLEQLVERRDSAFKDQDWGATKEVMQDMLNLIFIEPFTDAEFMKIAPMRASDWMADFFDDFETSSSQAALRAQNQLKKAQQRSKSAQPSRPTTKGRTR